MKKLLTLLGALALTASPAMVIVSCGQNHSKSSDDKLAIDAAEGLKKEVYQKILQNYNSNGKNGALAKTKDETDGGADGFNYSWLDYSKMNDKFSLYPSNIDNENEIDFKNVDNLTPDDNYAIQKDLNHILDLNHLAIEINSITDNKAYDIITSQVNKQIFKGWVITPISLNRISDPVVANEPMMVEFSFSLAATYQIYLNGSFQNITSDKISCSYSVAKNGAFKNIITWANNSIAGYLYTAPDKPFLLSSNNPLFDLKPMAEWTDNKNGLNRFKQNFNNNLSTYFQSFATDGNINAQNISNSLKVILANPKEYGFEGDLEEIKNFGFDTSKILPASIAELPGEIATPDVVFGDKVNYDTWTPRLDVTGKDNPNKDIIRAVFGNEKVGDKDYLTVLENATKEYLDLNKDLPSLNPQIAKPLDSDAFYQGYSDFINSYGVELNEKRQIIIDKDNNLKNIDTDSIFAYGHVNLAPISLEFENYSSGLFKLNLNIPWSMGLFDSSQPKNEVDRGYSAMSYFIALAQWKEKLNVNYFQIGKTNNVGDVTHFMQLDTYDKTKATDGLYRTVDPDLYYPFWDGDGKTNDPDIYNMLLDMDSTIMGSEYLNLDDGTLAKSDTWDDLIGKSSRDGVGNTQYYFEKYAATIPDNESLADWKNKTRINEENGLVYWGFHYDTTKNKYNPSIDVSMPFTQRKGADTDFLEADPNMPNYHNGALMGIPNYVPQNWHSKIRHEQDKEYNDKSLVYTLAMGNYGMLNLSFPSFNYTEVNYNSTSIWVGDGVGKSVWEYLWNPHRGDINGGEREAMRIISDSESTY